MTSHSSVLARRTPWTGGLEGCSPRRRRGSDATEPTQTHGHVNTPGGPVVKTLLPRGLGSIPGGEIQSQKLLGLAIKKGKR